MRHKRNTARFGRDTKARRGLFRNLVDSLVEHGRISTTVAKAKELRRHAERAVTLGKKGTLHARRVLLARYPNKSTVESIVTDIAPRFKDRDGGYTRVIKTGVRKGDCAEMAFIEWVDYELPTAGDEKTDKKATPAKKKVAKAAKKTTASATAKKAKSAKKEKSE